MLQTLCEFTKASKLLTISIIIDILIQKHSDLKPFKKDHLLKEYCYFVSEKLKRTFEEALSFGADLNSKSHPRKQKTQNHLPTVVLTRYVHGLANESPYTSGFSFAK